MTGPPPPAKAKAGTRWVSRMATPARSPSLLGTQQQQPAPEQPQEAPPDKSPTRDTTFTAHPPPASVKSGVKWPAKLGAAIKRAPSLVGLARTAAAERDSDTASVDTTASQESGAAAPNGKGAKWASRLGAAVRRSASMSTLARPLAKESDAAPAPSPTLEPKAPSPPRAQAKAANATKPPPPDTAGAQPKAKWAARVGGAVRRASLLGTARPAAAPAADDAPPVYTTRARAAVPAPSSRAHGVGARAAPVRARALADERVVDLERATLLQDVDRASEKQDDGTADDRQERSESPLAGAISQDLFERPFSVPPDGDGAEHGRADSPFTGVVSVVLPGPGAGSVDGDGAAYVNLFIHGGSSEHAEGPLTMDGVAHERAAGPVADVSPAENVEESTGVVADTPSTPVVEERAARSTSPVEDVILPADDLPPVVDAHAVIPAAQIAPERADSPEYTDEVPGGAWAIDAAIYARFADASPTDYAEEPEAIVDPVGEEPGARSTSPFEDVVLLVEELRPVVDDYAVMPAAQIARERAENPFDDASGTVDARPAPDIATGVSATAEEAYADPASTHPTPALAVLPDPAFSVVLVDAPPACPMTISTESDKAGAEQLIVSADEDRVAGAPLRQIKSDPDELWTIVDAPAGAAAAAHTVEGVVADVAREFGLYGADPWAVSAVGHEGADGVRAVDEANVDDAAVESEMAAAANIVHPVSQELGDGLSAAAVDVDDTGHGGVLGPFADEASLSLEVPEVGAGSAEGDAAAYALLSSPSVDIDSPEHAEEEVAGDPLAIDAVVHERAASPFTDASASDFVEEPKTMVDPVVEEPAARSTHPFEDVILPAEDPPFIVDAHAVIPAAQIAQERADCSEYTEQALGGPLAINTAVHEQSAGPFADASPSDYVEEPKAMVDLVVEGPVVRSMSPFEDMILAEDPLPVVDVPVADTLAVEPAAQNAQERTANPFDDAAPVTVDARPAPDIATGVSVPAEEAHAGGHHAAASTYPTPSLAVLPHPAFSAVLVEEPPVSPVKISTESDGERAQRLIVSADADRVVDVPLAQRDADELWTIVDAQAAAVAYTIDGAAGDVASAVGNEGADRVRAADEAVVDAAAVESETDAPADIAHPAAEARARAAAVAAPVLDAQCGPPVDAEHARVGSFADGASLELPEVGVGSAEGGGAAHALLSSPSVDVDSSEHAEEEAPGDPLVIDGVVHERVASPFGNASASDYVEEPKAIVGPVVEEPATRSASPFEDVILPAEGLPPVVVPAAQITQERAEDSIDDAASVIIDARPTPDVATATEACSGDRHAAASTHLTPSLATLPDPAFSAVLVERPPASPMRISTASDKAEQPIVSAHEDRVVDAPLRQIQSDADESWTIVGSQARAAYTVEDAPVAVPPECGPYEANPWAVSAVAHKGVDTPRPAHMCAAANGVRAVVEANVAAAVAESETDAPVYVVRPVAGARARAAAVAAPVPAAQRGPPAASASTERTPSPAMKSGVYPATPASGDQVPSDARGRATRTPPTLGTNATPCHSRRGDPANPERPFRDYSGWILVGLAGIVTVSLMALRKAR